MELQTLKVQIRHGNGKGKARQTRREGYVPGVVYGGGKDPVSVRMNARDFFRLTHGRGGEHAILQLEVEGDAAQSGPAQLKAIQRHPIRGQAIHADFLRISLDERITTMVPVQIEGRAPGVVEGGMLEVVLREIEVECRALEVPEALILDVSELELGQSLPVSALVAPENVTIVTDPERTVVSIHAPRVAEEAAEAAEGEEAEPEVIGKKEEEGEA
jgi:large subunit ribosomal protein L25